jgi:hypothetical protein
MRFSCGESNIFPEYNFESRRTFFFDLEWKTIPVVQFSCNETVLLWQSILPGATLEGTFTLATLVPGYDTSALRNPGAYSLRFKFSPKACIASPDGKFCLNFPFTDYRPHRY